MSLQFHVLASGSSGNACVLEAGGFGVLIDFGLSPRALAPRMRRCALHWNRIHAVVLTHPHSDHYQPASLAHLAKLGLPIYCHPDHLNQLPSDSRAFRALVAAGLIRHYTPGEPLNLHGECRCLPIEVPHDGATTCGFRFDGPDWSVGYLTDLGSWQPALARQFCDVDLLALEFNHDVALQMRSGRHPKLIRRVLGDHGHLSNEQAADLLKAILKDSKPGRLRHLVQLHLSRECNRPELAHAAAEEALASLGIGVSIVTAEQDQAGLTIDLHAPIGSTPPRLSRQAKAGFTQPLLPFGE